MLLERVKTFKAAMVCDSPHNDWTMRKAGSIAIRNECTSSQICYSVWESEEMRGRYEGFNALANAYNTAAFFYHDEVNR